VEKKVGKGIAEQKKGRMFAAAKKGNRLYKATFIARDFWIRKRGKKNFFQKRSEKYCGIRKRVLYLHPLREESL
jgi:hypothetical protein